MDAIRMQTLVDNICNGHESCHIAVIDRDMSGGKSLLLIKSPDMQLVDGKNAFNLNWYQSRDHSREIWMDRITDLFDIMLHVLRIQILRHALQQNNDALLDCTLTSAPKDFQTFWK